MKFSRMCLILVGFTLAALTSCQATKPRGPQPKSSYMSWDRPSAGQGGGALGSMIQRQE